ncbi:MAG: hypothetical protein WC055_10040 [Melioribacteraceae bacterium]
MNEIKIDISGVAASGKSRLMLLIGNFLNKEGFKVSFKEDEDWLQEDQQLKTELGSHLEDAIEAIKQKSTVSLKTVLVKEPTICDKIIGMTYEKASEYVNENNFTIRKTVEDGIPFMVTMDMRANRINVSVNNGIVISASIS